MALAVYDAGTYVDGMKGIVTVSSTLFDRDAIVELNSMDASDLAEKTAKERFGFNPPWFDRQDGPYPVDAQGSPVKDQLQNPVIGYHRKFVMNAR
jgi:hypothetical protein